MYWNKKMRTSTCLSNLLGNMAADDITSPMLSAAMVLFVGLLPDT